MFKRKDISNENLTEFMSNSMSGFLGMEVIEIGEDYLVMSMPVNERTVQPFGLLNGGASMALAESVASLAGNLVVGDDKNCVGLEINGNHIKAVRKGKVYAKATPFHLGSKTQVWDIKITDDENDLVNISRMTLAVINRK